MIPSEHRSTPPFPFHPHWRTAVGPLLCSPVFMPPWGGLCLLISICSIKFLSSLHCHLSLHYSLLPKANKPCSAKLSRTCFPDSRQVHVIAEIVLHPHHRGWGCGCLEPRFLSHTGDLKSRASTPRGKYFANEKRRR